jgi:SPP1 gp7 family putative phage head morphogenesis protein
MKKTKLERRYIAVSRILRKRNYGFIKVLDSYSNTIYKTIYTKTATEQMGRAMYNQLKGRSTQSLEDVFKKLNDKLKLLEPKIAAFITKFLDQGSSKVFDAKGTTLRLTKPNYTKVIQQLTKNNLKYIKDITEDQRKKTLDILSKGIKDGKSYAQMADSIVDEVEHISQSRAKLIASNEGHGAHARAMEDTMRKNGIDKYQWLTAADNRVSAICQSYHRQIFAFGKVGKMRWRDIDGKIHIVSKSPKPIKDSHIGCRCVIISVID